MSAISHGSGSMYGTTTSPTSLAVDPFDLSLSLSPAQSPCHSRSNSIGGICSFGPLSPQSSPHSVPASRSHRTPLSTGSSLSFPRSSPPSASVSSKPYPWSVAKLPRSSSVGSSRSCGDPLPIATAATATATATTTATARPRRVLKRHNSINSDDVGVDDETFPFSFSPDDDLAAAASPMMTESVSPSLPSGASAETIATAAVATRLSFQSRSDHGVGIPSSASFRQQRHRHQRPDRTPPGNTPSRPPLHPRSRGIPGGSIQKQVGCASRGPVLPRAGPEPTVPAAPRAVDGEPAPPFFSHEEERRRGGVCEDHDDDGIIVGGYDSGTSAVCCPSYFATPRSSSLEKLKDNDGVTRIRSRRRRRHKNVLSTSKKERRAAGDETETSAINGSSLNSIPVSSIPTAAADSGPKENKCNSSIRQRRRRQRRDTPSTSDEGASCWTSSPPDMAVSDPLAMKLTDRLDAPAVTRPVARGDVGEYRLLSEHVLYLCSYLLDPTASDGHSTGDVAIGEGGGDPTSLRRRRGGKGHDAKKACASHTNVGPSGARPQDILELCACVSGQHERMMLLDDPKGGEDVRLRLVEIIGKVAMAISLPTHQKQSGGLASDDQEENGADDNTNNNHMMAHALAALAYFLTLDDGNSSGHWNFCSGAASHALWLQCPDALAGLAKLCCYHDNARKYQWSETETATEEEKLQGNNTQQRPTPKTSAKKQTEERRNDPTPSPVARDPTASGRRRKKRMRIMVASPAFHSEIDAVENPVTPLTCKKESGLDFVSSSVERTTPRRIARQHHCRRTNRTLEGLLSTLRIIVGEELRRPSLPNAGASRRKCSRDSVVDAKLAPNVMTPEGLSPSVLAWISLRRILMPAVDHENSYDDCNLDHKYHNKRTYRRSSAQDPKEEEKYERKYMGCMRKLREQGALADLSLSISNQIHHFLLTEDAKNEDALLQAQVLRAALPILDGMCSLPENRHSLSIASPLVDRLACLSSHGIGNEFSHDDETSLAALRTLVSLTHENPAAGEILVQDRGKQGSSAVASLFQTLVQQAHWHESSEDDGYDASLFCLNVLTNVVEMTGGRARRSVVDVGTVVAPKPVGWLAKWAVGHTDSFREDVLRGKGNLAQGQEENLVVAGSAFVLLVWLMKYDGTAKEDMDGVDRNVEEWRLSNKIRETVWENMPLEEDGSRSFTLIVNTLKAFLNFYNYTLGSVRDICRPLIGLIKDMEDIMTHYEDRYDGKINA